MGNSGDKILPVQTCKRKLANDFSAFFNTYFNFFNTYEHKERTRIDRYTFRKFGDKLFSGVPLNTFMDATEAEIWNII